jgi:dihydrofolate reductase
MRNLIVTEFVSLDGVMEAPGGEPSHPHTGWTMDYEGEHMQYKFEETMAAETLLIGRVTYESFAGAWPTYEGEFADKMNSMPKVVVSKTLTNPAWNNTTVLAGDAVAGVTELKETDGGPILVAGSETLVHTLIENDLVDELRLMVYPVIIGGGLRVFPDNGLKKSWAPTDSVSYPAGVRLDTYRAV